MKTHILEVVNSSKLKTLSIKVTEEIQPKYLCRFLQTNILNSDISTSSNTLYYYSFIRSNMSYEVILFDKPQTLTKHFILEPFLLFGYYDIKNNSTTTDLFVADTYFVVYRYAKLLLFKNISHTTMEEIVLYLLQTYKIEIDNKIQIDDNLLKRCKDSYDKNQKIQNNYQLNLLFVDKSFKILQIFIVILTMIFSYFIYNNLNKNQTLVNSSKELTNLKNRYNNLFKIYQDNSKKPINSMINLVKYIKLNKITLEKIEYKDNYLETILIHRDKEVLLNTVTMYGKKADINYIKYDSKLEVYKMEILIEL